MMSTERASSILACALVIGCGAGTDARQTVPPSSRSAAPVAQDQAGRDASADLANASTSDPRCHGKSTPQLIQEIMERAAAVKPCYERALLDDAHMQGHLRIRLRVNHEGLGSVLLLQDEVQSSAFTSCITRKLTDAPFVAQFSGDCLDFIVPLSFVPKKTPADAGSD
jgi:hypothetical protein